MPNDSEVLISIKVSERKIHSVNSVISWRDNVYVVLIIFVKWQANIVLKPFNMIQRSRFPRLATVFCGVKW